MLKNYFKVAMRNLLRQKVTTSINIIGLAIGISCSSLILFWVKDEISYDQFHKNLHALYRITADGGDIQVATSMAGMGPSFEAQLPEVKESVRLLGAVHWIDVGNVKYEEKRIFYTDPAFLQMFSFPLLKGDTKTALLATDGILITEAMAKKYFGQEKEVIGKVLKIDNKHIFNVVGILANVPSNSHLQFDFILPMSFLAKSDPDLKVSQWDNFKFYTYLQVEENAIRSPASKQRVEQLITQIYRQNSGETADKVKLQLQAVSDVHLRSNFMMDVPGHGNIQYVQGLSIAGFIILIIACINFMSLSTARSSQRALEVGLRKAIGADRVQLIVQFMGESFLTTVIALLIASLAILLILPTFNDLVGKRITFGAMSADMITNILIISLLTGLISGSYPALFLSRFNPVSALKGNYKATKSNIIFRNSLVVVQFIVSIILLLGTSVVYLQMRYIQEKNLGYDKENLIYIPLTGNLKNKEAALRIELERNPLTQAYSIVEALPTNLVSGTSSVQWEGKDPGTNPIIANLAIDQNFLDVMEIKVIKGRNFSTAFRADSNNVLVNERLLNVMGMDEATAIGKPISIWDRRGTIIGVVKNFHFKSLQQSIEPLVLYNLNGLGAYVIVRTNPNATKSTISSLENICKKLNPEYPFTFDFVDQDLARLYQGERRMGNILKIFAVLAILISCMGIYGLSAFMAEKRKKEIGIRKVLGASVFHIVYLLSKKFIGLLFFAIVIAIPIAWFMMNSWLAGFTYHISISVLVLLATCLVAVLIVALTISHESVKAAVTNPIKSLRNE